MKDLIGKGQWFAVSHRDGAQSCSSPVFKDKKATREQLLKACGELLLIDPPHSFQFSEYVQEGKKIVLRITKVL